MIARKNWTIKIYEAIETKTDCKPSIDYWTKLHIQQLIQESNVRNNHHDDEFSFKRKKKW